MRLPRRAEALECRDLPSLELAHRQHARARCLPVDVHGARAALREPATKLRTVEREVVAQDIQQRRVGIGFSRARLAVDPQGIAGYRSLLPREGFSLAASTAKQKRISRLSRRTPGPRGPTCPSPGV